MGLAHFLLEQISAGLIDPAARQGEARGNGVPRKNRGEVDHDSMVREGAGSDFQRPMILRRSSRSPRAATVGDDLKLIRELSCLRPDVTEGRNLVRIAIQVER